MTPKFNRNQPAIGPRFSQNTANPARQGKAEYYRRRSGLVDAIAPTHWQARLLSAQGARAYYGTSPIAGAVLPPVQATNGAVVSLDGLCRVPFARVAHEAEDGSLRVVRLEPAKERLRCRVPHHDSRRP